ncbi:NADPH-dependent FMN reductase [Photobacterium sp. GB-27]|uniref:NADPH-dependent FMN reductase n=1 Tax=unclassified Photobacterium TaxID=2628852 RepID=UPI000D17E0DD|nr:MULTISPECIES: NAD(P)H-dependent oxidoreductase [unclassified Photobacterium]PSV34673.1 NADPH-dependent FMN reductase [Photobacterium sp. GB-27]PSV38142.1 NADPH-dependent FMN reductase [Photobacterium sp. GB-210]PSV41488.1 NADPH-dependent FMN reductase [Photobacterium sp. GB-36]PSW73616.1 NADPH-dependent FMN reductase [Photobacterium sp. GB-50]
MKLLAFAASNSQHSINHALVTYAASQANADDVEILDLNDFEMAIYSIDRENNSGIPEQAQIFFDKIGQADAILISFAEYNGSYTSAYKNVFDWTSRIDQKVFQNKPVIMLATSPGPGGAASVLNSAVTSAPYFDAKVVGSLSIPSFYENFDLEKNTLINDDLNQQLTELINKLER